MTPAYGVSAAAMRAGAWAVALACCGLPAWAQAPLATPSGWEAGVQFSDYRYEEPGIMTLEGARFGLSGAYTTALNPSRAFARLEGRWSYGELEYQGSGVLTGVPDRLFEFRLLAGGDYAAGRVLWSPYVGAGFRYLHNDLRGVTSTGAVGYRRESNYFYLPLGVTLRMPLAEGWLFAPQIEYDVFVRGTQRPVSINLTGRGFKALRDVADGRQGGPGAGRIGRSSLRCRLRQLKPVELPKPPLKAVPTGAVLVHQPSLACGELRLGRQITDNRSESPTGEGCRAVAGSGVFPATGGRA